MLPVLDKIFGRHPTTEQTYSVNMIWPFLFAPTVSTVAYWLYFRLKTASGRSLSDVQQARFPLGSLAMWTDLLWMNRRILAEADAKTGVCVQWMGTTRAWAITKAAHVDILVKNSVSRGAESPSLAARIVMAAGSYHIKMFMGWNSVGVLEGKPWKEVRGTLGKFVSSAQHLKLQFEPIKAAANDLVNHFESKGDQLQEVSEPLFAMAYDILSNAVFGEPAYFLRGFTNNGDMDPVVHALAETMHEMTRRMGSPNPLDWLYVLDGFRPSQQRFVEAQRIVWTYVKQVVERRRKDQTESFLYHLLKAASDAVVYDNVQTCMWAGHESTAASISFILYELSTRPDIQQKLRDEVSSVVGAGGQLEYDHVLSKLPFVNAVVDEALRLHPPAIWTNRQVSTEQLELYGEKLFELSHEEVQEKALSQRLQDERCERRLDEAQWRGRIFIKSKKGLKLEVSDAIPKEHFPIAVFLDLDEVIPQGSLVFVPIEAVHRSHLNWDNPEEFRPERFLNNQAVPGSHVPFGGGLRVCPGWKLAPFEIRVTLAVLALRGFEVFRRSDDPHPQPEIRANGAFQLCLNNHLRLSFNA